MMDAKGVRNMQSILVDVNKHNTARVASCWFIIYYIPDTSQSSTNTERPLNISVSLPMPFAAVVHPAEGQIGRLKSKVNKLISLKFLFGTRKPTVSKRLR